MGSIITLSGRGELPSAPAAIADEVELYARESGRHAKIHLIPTEIDMKTGRVLKVTWRVDLDLHPDDPEMGPSGVRQFLEQGNIHSGRGEFSSMDDVLRKTAELNDKNKVKRKDDTEDRVRVNARDKRRSRQKIPYLTVEADLTVPTTQGEPQ